MCLGIPARITAIVDPVLGTVMAESDGVSREVNVSMLLVNGETMANLPGKWVLLHVGFAMAIVDEQEALQTLNLLKTAGEL